MKTIEEIVAKIAAIKHEQWIKRAERWKVSELWDQTYALQAQAAALFGQRYGLKPARHWSRRRGWQMDSHYMDHPYFYRDAARNNAVVAHPYADIESEQGQAPFRQWAAENGWTIEFLPEIPSWWNPGNTKVVLYREIREWYLRESPQCCTYGECHARGNRRYWGWRFCDEHRNLLAGDDRKFHEEMARKAAAWGRGEEY